MCGEVMDGLRKMKANLENTISGKELLKKALEQNGDYVANVTAQFIDVNLTELNNILDHVNQLLNTELNSW